MRLIKKRATKIVNKPLEPIEASVKMKLGQCGRERVGTAPGTGRKTGHYRSEKEHIANMEQIVYAEFHRVAVCPPGESRS